MPKILCIETTTTNCSVALGQNGETIALIEDKSDGYSHAEKLHLFVEDILKQAQLSLSQLDAIAISKGPGSYTGLRIGTSAAKGLCFAQNIPLIAVETLSALAQQVTTSGLIIPMLDARRMEVYSAIFSGNKKIRETQAQILDELSFKQELESHQVTFIGNGVEKFKAICPHPNAHFISSLPSATDMVALATHKYKSDTFEDVAYFEPFYLKNFIAGKKKTA